MQFDQLQRREFISLLGGAAAIGRSRSVISERRMSLTQLNRVLGETRFEGSLCARSGICSSTLEKDRMSDSEGQSGEKARSPQQVLMQVPQGMWAAQCIATAARLGIADALAQSQPQGSIAIARAVGADGPALARLLRALASLGSRFRGSMRWRIAAQRCSARRSKADI
jgi:hypothetical protein